jgi:hypothetical protein
MSEYQFIAFRAIDGPVSEKNLDYMRRQSKRAEITPWSFENEYNYGDFDGNVLEMLRRGYDIHFHYANFGIRKLLIRFPHGLPDLRAAKPYFVKDSLRFIKDKQGEGGVLEINPYFEPDDLEDLYDLDSILERLAPLRAEILDGDLRPLYIAHLGVVSSGEHDPDETQEGPVPARLDKPSHAQLCLAEVYGLKEALIEAAAQAGPPMTATDDVSTARAEWLREQPELPKDAWLAAMLADPSAAVRAEILAKFRADQPTTTWPTAQPNRTISQLQVAAAEVANVTKRKAAAKAARQRAKKLAEMALDPDVTLRATNQLVAKRSKDAYRRASELLADLREALAESGRSALATEKARQLVVANPTLRALATELRRQKLFDK